MRYMQLEISFPLLLACREKSYIKNTVLLQTKNIMIPNLSKLLQYCRFRIIKRTQRICFLLLKCKCVKPNIWYLSLGNALRGISIFGVHSILCQQIGSTNVDQSCPVQKNMHILSAIDCSWSPKCLQIPLRHRRHHHRNRGQ